MTEERKKNACAIIYHPTSGEKIYLLAMCVSKKAVCEYGSHNEDDDRMCDCQFIGESGLMECNNTEAKSDALNRASAAINEEQARRSNEAQSTEEIVERAR